MEAREAQAREAARQEELAALARQKADLIRRHSDLLLMMFDELARSEDAQRRGYLLQDLLNRLFDIHEIPVVRSFTRNDGAEQVDGAFKLEGWHYIVECRWRSKLADIREPTDFLGRSTDPENKPWGFSFRLMDGLKTSQERLNRIHRNASF